MNVGAIFGFISGIAWLAAILVFVWIVIRASRNRPVQRPGLALFVVLVLAIILTAVSSGIVFINPQESGVVISLLTPEGYRKEALTPGLHVIVPFAESVIRYPTYRQTYTMSVAPKEGQIQGDDSISARTADGQEIFVDASVIYQINPGKVVEVHLLWQNRYEDELVRPLARGVIRDVVSQYGVEQVVSTKRAEMTNTISRNLGAKLEENGLQLVDFVLRNITFSTEYSASVEQKQIAEQQAQQAALVVEQKKQEAEQVRQQAKGQADAQVTQAQGQAQARILQAQAEAQATVIQAEADAKARVIQAQAEKDALLLINDALKNNPDLLTYQYINKISPNVQVMFLPSSAPFVFPLPQYGPQPSTTTTTPSNP